MLRKDIYYGGSVSHLKEYQTCGGSMASFLAAMTRETDSDDVSTYSDVSTMASRAKASRDRSRRSGWSRCEKWARNMVNVKMLASKEFLIHLIIFTMWTGSWIFLILDLTLME